MYNNNRIYRVIAGIIIFIHLLLIIGSIITTYHLFGKNYFNIIFDITYYLFLFCISTWILIYATRKEKIQ
ncbi:hypothetical protein SAMN05421761_10750 [Belliella pelovolcani]|uniref:Uncharacterized protein n=1 Tax=Belliella pelovolcani TaxID=529505 RepID=A0A1N7MQR4_9BACT|nr:hypothetical protein SAMN05421761_10750 [Belliella pelovolcani]